MNFVVEIEHTWHEYPNQDQRIERGSLQEAAAIFESNAEPPKNWPLSQIEDDLRSEGRVEFENDSGVSVVAYELEGALV